MRIRMPSTILVGLLLSATNYGGTMNMILCDARKSPTGGSSSNSRSSMPSSSSRRSNIPNPAGPGSLSRGGGSNSRRSSSSSSTRRKTSVVMDEYDDMTEDDGYSEEHPSDDEGSDSQGYDTQEIGDDEYDDEDDDPYDYDDLEYERDSQRQRIPQSQSTRRTPPSKTNPNSRSNKPRNRSSPPPTRPSRTSHTNSRSSSSRHKVTPTTKHRRPPPPPPPSAFSRGLTALRSSIPDPHTLKDKTISSLHTAKETTTRISSSLYREVKILSSSELEQAFLKATIPNDSPAKEKHVERLVMITYQVSAGYNIFEVVLRKLWSKMVESDWRTKMKAVYVLHRFGTDGAPQQQMALKTMLREMRRTKDPKRKMKYFNTKQLLEGEVTPANIMYRTFLARYAHYVLLRVQCFGGMFTEINPPHQKKPLPSKSSSSKAAATAAAAAKTPEKPITSTRLKKECLDAAQVVLKAGLACKLKPMEECENTVAAMERVVSDMIGLTTAVAAALNSALGGGGGDDTDASSSVDKHLIKLWCEFYTQELVPQTKAMIKSATPTLDAFGIFLPSRMGTTVSQDLLQKGLAYTPPTTKDEGEENEVSVQGAQDQELNETDGRGDEKEGNAADLTEKDDGASRHGDDATSVGGSNGDNYQVHENVEDTEEYDEYEYDEYYDTEYS